MLIRVKAVPGASRDEIAGSVGDRLKVRTPAPPEGGRANRSICRIIAGALGVRAQRVSIESGRAGPEKVVRVSAATSSDVAGRLGVA